MAIKFEKITPGMTLFSVGKQTAGNTTYTRWASWTVRIISVDAVARTAVVSWNSNKPETWSALRLAKLYTIEPKRVRDQRARGW